MATKGTKKSAVKIVKPKEGRPSPEMLADLTEVFKKHGWTGLPHHLAFSATSAEDGPCPGGSPRQQVTINCPGGITKVVFICPGDDPGC